MRRTRVAVVKHERRPERNTDQAPARGSKRADTAVLYPAFRGKNPNTINEPRAGSNETGPEPRIKARETALPRPGPKICQSVRRFGGPFWLAHGASALGAPRRGRRLRRLHRRGGARRGHRCARPTAPGPLPLAPLSAVHSPALSQGLPIATGGRGALLRAGAPSSFADSSCWRPPCFGWRQRYAMEHRLREEPRTRSGNWRRHASPVLTAFQRRSAAKAPWRLSRA